MCQHQQFPIQAHTVAETGVNVGESLKLVK